MTRGRQRGWIRRKIFAALGEEAYTFDQISSSLRNLGEHYHTNSVRLRANEYNLVVKSEDIGVPVVRASRWIPKSKLPELLEALGASIDADSVASGVDELYREQ